MEFIKEEELDVDEKSNLLAYFVPAIPSYDCQDAPSLFYTCKQCPFQTPFKVTLYTHTATTHRDYHSPPSIKEYRCKRCDFYSSSVLTLAGHIFHRCRSRSTSKSPFFKCPHCPYTATTRPRLKVHNLWNHIDPLNSQWFECEQCSFRTKRKGNLQQHFLAKHTAKESKCVLNTNTSVRKRKLRAHMLQTHSGKINVLKCDLCSYQSTEQRSLTKHMQNKHPGTMQKVVVVLSCTLCPYKSTRNCNYTRHMISKHPHLVKVKWFECEHCDYKTKENSTLQKHIMAKHTHPKDRQWFQCNHCDYKGPSKYTLKLHSSRMHQNEGLPRVPIIRKPRAKSVLCDQCSYATIDTTNLKRHMKSKHPHLVSVKWFECEHCDYKTKENSTLQKHIMAKHTDPEDRRWFQCDHCVYKGPSKYTLKLHSSRMHQKEGFPKIGKSRKPRPKNVFCEQCSFSTIDSSNLKRHMISKHPHLVAVEWLECEHCEYKTQDKVNLKKHVLVKHSHCHTVKIKDQG